MRGPAVVYVGNLPNDIKERELQELFDKVRRALQLRRSWTGSFYACMAQLTSVARLVVAVWCYQGHRHQDPTSPPSFCFH